jgi:hypothetical protein
MEKPNLVLKIVHPQSGHALAKDYIGHINKEMKILPYF